MRYQVVGTGQTSTGRQLAYIDLQYKKGDDLKIEGHDAAIMKLHNLELKAGGKLFRLIFIE